MNLLKKFRDLSMKFQLIVFFLAVGTIPLAVAAWLSYSKADTALTKAKEQASDSLEKQTFAQLVAIRDVKREQVERYFGECQADLEALVETVATLREEALKRLVAVREVKRQAVARYSQTINDQAITFSEDKMVVEAMRQFRDSFQGVRAANKIETEDVAELRKEVRSYYTDQFAKEYMNRNGGRVPEVDSIIEKLDDDSIALQYYYIQKNDKPLGSKHLLDRAGDESEYSEIHGRIHPIVRSFLEKFGYYDIFLVDSQSGDIVYSVFKELDFSTSLLDGPYADTNFGEAFRRANAATNRDAVVLVDYARYAPSYEAAASFVACPIFDGDEKIGVAMFQMPIDRLNAIMGERAGLGETGETYLVGPDGLMRSDSYLDAKGRSVAASFANPETGKVDTAATKAALGGQIGAKLIIDYNGNPVLSAYAPVSMGDATWAIVAEIDVAEAFCPKLETAEKDYFTHYKERYGYYDLFLINPDGYCFYSVCREPDYQTNLVDGKYRDSNLGKLVRRVLQTKQFGFADFEPYAPSNGDPAAFVAQPVVDGEKLQVVVALQLPIDTVNAIMGVRAGMGETGETYLIGPDKRMRSDSFLDPEGHTVKASFAGTIEKNGVDTEAAREALADNTDARIITDYNGNPVLSAYTPMKLFDTTWALLAEIDEAEAFAPIREMQATANEDRTDLQRNAWLIAVLAVVAIAVVAHWVSGLITKPVQKVVGVLDMVAKGDYSQKADVRSRDEMGQMAGALNQTIDAVSKAMQDVRDAAEREKLAQAERAELEHTTAEAEQQRRAEID